MIFDFHNFFKFNLQSLRSMIKIVPKFNLQSLRSKKENEIIFWAGKRDHILLWHANYHPDGGQLSRLNTAFGSFGRLMQEVQFLTESCLQAHQMELKSLVKDDLQETHCNRKNKCPPQDPNNEKS